MTAEATYGDKIRELAHTERTRLEQEADKRLESLLPKIKQKIEEAAKAGEWFVMLDKRLVGNHGQLADALDRWAESVGLRFTANDGNSGPVIDWPNTSKGPPPPRNPISNSPTG